MNNKTRELAGAAELEKLARLLCRQHYGDRGYATPAILNIVETDWSGFTTQAEEVIALLARPPSMGWRPGREEIARIIDPFSWSFHARHVANPIMAAEVAEETRPSLAKADDILSLPAETVWRGIESAPKDGTPIDLWVVFPKGGVRWADAAWREENQHNCSGPADWTSNDGWPLHAMLDKPTATHWMPLPPLPVGGGGENSSSQSKPSGDARERCHDASISGGKGEP